MIDNTQSGNIILNLKCQNCGGTYSTNESDINVLECPFCHSKQLIIDSDAVKIAKEKYAAYRDVELGKQQTYKDIEIEKERLKQGYTPLTEEDKKMYMKMLAGVGVVILVCLLLLFFCL